MLSLPPALGVKLTVVANDPPPLSVDEHDPVVLAVAVAVALVPANVTAAAGLAPHPASFNSVVTGFSVAEGLTAVPTAELGTPTLFSVICPTVSPPLAVITVE
jgi:hypothetical protein